MITNDHQVALLQTGKDFVFVRGFHAEAGWACSIPVI